jgi:chlorobactene glucosyltransferase
MVKWLFAEHIPFITSLLGLLALTYRLKPWHAWRAVPLMPASDADKNPSLPFISIIVPCRNEEAQMSGLLHSLAAIEYPHYEILIVDDQSTDQTAQVTNALLSGLNGRAKLLRAPPKPAGWVGKNWACHLGASVARGELLLFTDADTRHLPSSLHSAVSYLQTQKADLISAPPFHECQLGFEKWNGFFALLPLIATAFLDRPSRRRLFAIGQYLLIKKTVYLQFDGHRALAASFAEDVDMATLVLKAGFRYAVYPKADIFRVQMYENASAFLAGWRRLLRLGLKRGSLMAFIEISLIAQLLAIGIWKVKVEMLVLFSLAVVVIALSQARFGKFRFLGALLAPLSMLLFSILTFIAIVDSVFRRNLVWRGRSYKAGTSAAAAAVLLTLALSYSNLAKADPVKHVIEVQVVGMRTGDGNLAMSVFAKDAKKSFPSDGAKAIRSFYIPLEGKKEITVSIPDLDEGDYAISVMHDEDSNHKMTFNFLGIPKKGFGFSKNPKVYFGPPSFDHAEVHLAPTEEAPQIKMKYFL